MGAEIVVFITPFLPIIWSTVGLAAVAYLFKWIAAKINGTKIGAATALDDLVMEWARIAVSNVGAKTVDKVKLALADGKIDDAEYKTILSGARIDAIEQMRELARMSGQELKLENAVATGAIDVLIRKAVDDRQKMIRYEERIIEGERKEHDVREAEFAKENPPKEGE